MPTNFIFPSPPLQESPTHTMPKMISTRLGLPTPSPDPTLSSIFPIETDLGDSSAILKSGWVVTQTGETSTAIEKHPTAASPMDVPTLGASSIALNAGLSESRSALIIGSLALVLVVTLVIVLVAWFVISRRQRKRNPEDETGELMGYLDKERGITYERNIDSMSGGDDGTREGAEDSRHNIDTFNSLNMVVDRSVITSMTMSQFTIASNPPPPYGNDQINSIQAVFPQGPAPSSQPADGGQPPASNNEPNQTLRAIPGAEASFVALARLLPPTITVQCTFTPTSPDEMKVKRGDQMQVTGVFDDGWCLCRAENGRVGVVPLACLDIPESAFTSPDPVRPGLRAQNVTSDEDVRGQRQEENGSEAVNERELVNQTRFGVLGGERRGEKGRLVTRSPRLSSRSVVIVQNESRDDK